MKPKNILESQTWEPHNYLGIVASPNAETGSDHARSAAPFKRGTQPVKLDRQKTRPKVVEFVDNSQIQSETAIHGMGTLAEWCRQLPALQLRNGRLCLASGDKTGWKQRTTS